MEHRVPGVGRRGVEPVVAEVEDAHVRQVGQGVSGHEGQLVEGGVELLKLRQSQVGQLAQ